MKPKIITWEVIEFDENPEIYQNGGLVPWAATSPLHFIGVYNELPDAHGKNVGDVIVCNNMTYINAHDKWEELQEI
jgi:hypothetical protein